MDCSGDSIHGSAMSDMRSGWLASLRRDRAWVERAREVAFELVDDDPDLTRHEALRDEVRLLLDEGEADFLLKS